MLNLQPVRFPRYTEINIMHHNNTLIPLAVLVVVVVVGDGGGGGLWLPTNQHPDQIKIAGPTAAAFSRPCYSTGGLAAH